MTAGTPINSSLRGCKKVWDSGNSERTVRMIKWKGGGRLGGEETGNDGGGNGEETVEMMVRMRRRGGATRTWIRVSECTEH
eukprot:429573-Pelagomonas_calceolata.AAC.6